MEFFAYDHYHSNKYLWLSWLPPPFLKSSCEQNSTVNLLGGMTFSTNLKEKAQVLSLEFQVGCNISLWIRFWLSDASC